MTKLDYDPSEEYEHKDNPGVYKTTLLTIKPEHMKLLKRMNVRWNDAMAGAPEISAKKPYGNSSHLEDIRESTGMENADDEWCRKVHREMAPVLEAFIREKGDIGPGDQIVYKSYKWILYEGEE